jgi:glyoxylase-like metal-dependent hydrolase (beta-lactamase superfamily II)
MKMSQMLSAGVLSLFIVGSGCAGQVKAKASESKVALYTFESDANGFNTKNYFYDNGQEVVAFDTQFTPAIAQASIDYLRTKTSNPITYVVVTHPNPDKFNGMSVFQKLGAKVVMSSKTAGSLQDVQNYKQYYFVKMAKMFTDETYPKLSKPDVVFNQKFDLTLSSGEILKLSELTHPGVSSNQTIAFISNLNSLIVGDLVHVKAHAWLEGGIVNGKPTPTLKGWISDLKEIEANFAPEVKVYGGRGEVASVRDAVQSQIRYLETADQIVNAYIKKLGAKVSELKTDQAQGHYQAIQKQFEARFPEYTLGYMIGYGVYGLVNAKL